MSPQLHAPKPTRSKMFTTLGVASSILGLLSCASTTVHAQEEPYDPRGTNCGFRNAGITVVDKTLYLDGGSWTDSYYWGGDPTKGLLEANYTRWQNEYLWKLDLSKGFDAKEPPWEIEAKPLSHDEHYNGNDGSLWNLGDGNFLTVGGTFDARHGPAPGALYERLWDPVARIYRTEPKMYRYSTSTRTWSVEQTLLSVNIKRMYAAASAVTLKPKKLAFNVGGLMVDQTEVVANTTSQSWADGNKMRIYNPEDKEWTVETLPTAMGWLSYAELHSLDAVGKSGVLVLLAGFRKSDLTVTTGAYRDMSDIWMYDIASKNWYSQKAIGEIPRGRWAACSILVPAPDESSYQIYLFSGSDDTMFLDLYVLSIPAFIWTKIPLKNYPNNWGYRYHSCVNYQNRQMLVANGEYNSSTTPQAAKTVFERPCPLGNPVKVFDTVSWEFLDKYDPDLKENLVPQSIVSIIGGNSKGNATVKTPRGGFERTAMAEAFAIRNNGALGGGGGNGNGGNNGKGGSNNNGTDTGDDEITGDGDKKAPIGAIVGGVVGGLVVIGLIAGFFLWRRRQTANAAATANATAAQNYAAGYAPGYPADPNAGQYPPGHGPPQQYPTYNSYNQAAAYGTYPGGGQQQYLAEAPAGTYVPPVGSPVVGGGAGYYAAEYKPAPAVEIGSAAAFTPPVEMPSPGTGSYISSQPAHGAGDVGYPKPEGHSS